MPCDKTDFIVRNRDLRNLDYLRPDEHTADLKTAVALLLRNTPIMVVEVEVEDFALTDLISAIGGSAGFYLGHSLWTVFEAIFWSAGLVVRWRAG